METKLKTPIHDIINYGIELIDDEDRLRSVLISVRGATMKRITDKRTQEIFKEICDNNEI